jgi:hypothetical protein
MAANKILILQMQIADLNEEIKRIETQHLTQLRKLRDSLMGPVQRFRLDNGTLGTEAQLIAEIPF